MQRFHGLLTGLAAALALTACGGDDGPSTPRITVDDLSEGSHIVSVGDEASPTVGKYYAAADGTRLLVLSGTDDRATQIYRRAAGEDWRGVPAPGSAATVRLLRSSALPTPVAVDAAALAGSYVTLLSGSTTARFSIRSDGAIVAGDSNCKLRGQLSSSPLPGALRASLTASDCGSFPASSSGTLVVDGDYQPARFRLVADDDKTPLDIWAHAE